MNKNNFPFLASLALVFLLFLVVHTSYQQVKAAVPPFISIRSQNSIDWRLSDNHDSNPRNTLERNNHIETPKFFEQYGTTRIRYLISESNGYESTEEIPTTVYLPFIVNSSCAPFYTDDFSNPASGWSIVETDKYKLEYLDNEYRILVKNINSMGAASVSPMPDDYIPTVDVRNTTGIYGYYGLEFEIKMSDWTEFYSFTINPNGSYAIHKYESSSGWTILSSGTSAFINTGTLTNHLEIRREGSLIQAYANDNLIADISDGTFTSGVRGTGMTAWTYGNINLDVRFDNFIVYPTTCEMTTELRDEINDNGGKKHDFEFSSQMFFIRPGEMVNEIQ